MHPPPSEPTTWSLPQLLMAVNRFKGRAILAFLLVMGASALALVYLPKEYASQAKLFVRLGRENVALDPTITKQEVVGLTTTRDLELNSILEHLRSRSIAEKVLQQLRPELQQAEPLKRDLALRALEKRIFVDAPKNSAVIVLHCEAQDAAEAQATLKAYIDSFLSEHMRVNHSSGSSEFFQNQAELLSKQIEDARAKLRDAKTQAGLASVEGLRTTLEQQISSAEANVSRVEAALVANKAKIESLQSAVQRLPEPLLGQLVNGTPNDGLATMRQTLFDLRTKEQELLSRLTPDHPAAIAIRQQVAGVEQALRASMPERQQVEQAVLVKELAEGDALTAELQAVQEQLKPLREKLRELNDSEGEIQTLASDLQRFEDRYQLYIERFEEARVDEALHADRITNVSILQPATLALTPIRPRKAAVLVMAVIAASLCSASVILLSEMLRPRSTMVVETLPSRRQPTAYAPEATLPRVPR